MKDLFSPAQGLALIAAYAVYIIAVAAIFSRRSQSKDELLVARRGVGMIPAAFSIASSWVWAPALFVAAQQAYSNGWPGLMWFTVPNVACLILFAFFAARVRAAVPEGYTLSDVMRARYSPRVQMAYLVQLGALSCCAFAVQLLAGAAALSVLTGLPFLAISVALAAIALTYSLWSGIRAGVATDFSKIIIIGLVAGTVVPAAIYAAGGVHALSFSGIGGHATDPFNGTLLATFGIPVTVGLLSGPFGDQSFWQRAFAVRADKVRGAFLLSALIFAVVPLSLGMLGFLAAGVGFTPTAPQMVNIEIVLKLLPVWVAIPFTFMILSGLTSVLDDNYCSISCLAGHDVVMRWLGGGSPLAAARYSMLALAVVGVGIANVPGLTILYLFLFYGTLRASTLLPTVMTILNVPLTERGVFWGVVLAIAGGLPVFAYGHLGGGGPAYIIGGSLATVLGSGLIAVILSAGAKAPAAA